MKKLNGIILWRGPSLIDGAPVAVIATGLASGSGNRKTGALVQTFILREDVSPTDAVRVGADVSICGNCPHRGNGDGSGRTCYVNAGQGPLSVWRAYKRGTYGDDVAPDAAVLLTGRLVRFGAYGDPAAVPVALWLGIAAVAKAWTGYTHQWRTADCQLARVCMASADTMDEAREAWAAGWRTFRVALPSHVAKAPGEAVCPASAEAGAKLKCADCLACHGTANGRRGSITIQAHGGFAVMANVRRRNALEAA